MLRQKYVRIKSTVVMVWISLQIELKGCEESHGVTFDLNTFTISCSTMLKLHTVNDIPFKRISFCIGCG